jgi:hypothetical protein
MTHKPRIIKRLFCLSAFKFIIPVTISALSFNANSSNWNAFETQWAGKSIIYFDKDTVVKKNGTVTLWIKLRNNPDFILDGYYGYANQTRYFCGKNQSQFISESKYDLAGNYMRTYFASPDVIVPIMPGGQTELLYPIVCDKTFPNNMDNLSYSKVTRENSTAAVLALYIDRKKNKADPAPN